MVYSVVDILVFLVTDSYQMHESNQNGLRQMHESNQNGFRMHTERKKKTNKS